MTVTVGFLCKDGVVLGADSQESYEGSALKRSVPKLVAFPPPNIPGTPDRRAIFTGAGDAAFVDKLIDEMWSEIGSAPPSVNEIATEIERRITELYAEYRELYHPGYMPFADITYGIWCGRESGLFHAHGPVVNRIGSRFQSAQGGYKSAGLGSEITDYIQARMKFKPPNVDQASVLARYMLEQAVAHGQGCGGDIRISWLKNDGTAKNVEIDRHTTRILSWLDHQISQAILVAADPQYPDEFVSAILEISTKQILKLRAEHRKAIATGTDNRKEYDRLVEEIDRMERELSAGATKIGK
jgi:hypothetical protein